ncbi:MAG: hypothetical protein RLZZ500_1601 [Bacteroidota bacterium]
MSVFLKKNAFHYCMSNTINVSVIIPVFNVEPYIDYCMQSLQKQSLSSIEFIFVNDGSSDATAHKIEEAAKKDNRIKLFHQENKGVSAARNVGLKNASGTFVTFVDGDDTIEPDYIEKMYQAASQCKASLIVANFKSETATGWSQSESVYDANRMITNEEIHQKIIPIFLQKDSLNSSCVKLFELQLIRDNQLFFPEGMTNGEDALFCLQAFSKATSVVFIQNWGYNYRSVVGSASRNIFSKDYLKIALDNFNFDHKKYADLHMDQESIHFYKSLRLIDNLYDLIHIYLRPNAAISWWERVKKVRTIIANPQVKSVIDQFGPQLEQETFGYRRKMLQSMRQQSLVCVLVLTFYSNFRNHYYF